MEENVSSKGSSGVDNMSTEGLDSNGDCYLAYPKKHLGHYSWGSQIYANSHQICLGIIKSEKEPEIAYDSAPHRNFPLTNVVKEPNFQSQYGQEAVVLETISGGSCQPRFQGLNGDNYGNTESGTSGLNLSAMQKRGGFLRKLLFRKTLTPSDVGRLNRIVIPKKNAATCFPEISRRMEEEAKAGVLPQVQVGFLDRAMRSWKFRYCYWKSSQSYVFTRGWNRFVKEKNLKVNDVVAFYLCEVQREGKIVTKFFMIDPVRSEDSSGSSSSSVIEVDDHNNVGLNQPEMLSSVFELGSSYDNVGLRPEMGGSVFEGSSSYHHHHVELKPELRSDVETKRPGKQVMDSDPPRNVERKGFRLFGVQMN